MGLVRGVLATAIPASFSPVTLNPGQRAMGTVKVRCVEGQGTLWAGGYLSYGADSSQWPTWPGRKPFNVYSGADNPAGSRNAKIAISQGQERTIVFQSDPVEIYQGVMELVAIWYVGMFDEAARVWTRFDDFGSHPGAVRLTVPSPVPEMSSADPVVQICSTCIEQPSGPPAPEISSANPVVSICPYCI